MGYLILHNFCEFVYDPIISILRLQISYSVYVPKIIKKIGWQQTKLLQKLSGLLFSPTLYLFTNGKYSR